MNWNRTPVRDEQWKVPVYSTKPSQSLEQDQAAGGRERRIVRGTEGALGRVVLQRRNLRIYAELRWQVDKRQYSRYLCPVSAATRTANLAAGWRRAHALGLTATSDSPDRAAAGD